jgi:hypothetical protein
VTAENLHGKVESTNPAYLPIIFYSQIARRKLVSFCADIWLRLACRTLEPRSLLNQYKFGTAFSSLCNLRL